MGADAGDEDDYGDSPDSTLRRRKLEVVRSPWTTPELCIRATTRPISRETARASAGGAARVVLFETA